MAPGRPTISPGEKKPKKLGSTHTICIVSQAAAAAASMYGVQFQRLLEPVAVDATIIAAPLSDATTPVTSGITSIKARSFAHLGSGKCSSSLGKLPKCIFLFARLLNFIAGLVTRVQSPAITSSDAHVVITGGLLWDSPPQRRATSVWFLGVFS
ncbi:hypothetical protein MRX96_033097 [Rhipicephalus microplus]